ncbi:FHA domain-containing protein [Lignipirellula cremea]|uniref:YscD cytoplasmic domain-containing protein n=1 Tax=Lignipirellula cremea TaxID=2528010 RepID=A0A518E383_9BACT|nr:FHA domain-containing protein [Lignipirellula cremea]QDU98546.1 hypothetical protein Pla8534_64150 [Lignipirellula cremea]
MPFETEAVDPQATSNSLTQEETPGVFLEILRGQARQKIRQVEEAVYLIGSASDCDLVLADPQFPDVHVYLYLKPDEVTMRVLGEGPVAAVNGEPVLTARLHDGDHLRTGPYEFCVHIGAQPGPRKKKPSTPSVRPHSLNFVYQVDPRGKAAVDRLLADVRATCSSPTRELRLYTECEVTIGQACRKTG